MAINNYSTDGLVIWTNGRIITDFAQTNPPYTDEPIDQVATLIRGMGGRAIVVYRKIPGRRSTINLMPGSPDSAFFQGLFTSQAIISTFYRTQIGTLENVVAGDGCVINTGTTGRGGSEISADTYILEFALWNETKGGV